MRVLRQRIDYAVHVYLIFVAPPMYYVPVLRAADNCTPPQLTPPCTIAEYRVHHGTLSDDRGTPVIGQAFAGPMSPAQVLFYMAHTMDQHMYSTIDITHVYMYM